MEGAVPCGIPGGEAGPLHSFGEFDGEPLAAKSCGFGHLDYLAIHFGAVRVNNFNEIHGEGPGDFRLGPAVQDFAMGNDYLPGGDKNFTCLDRFHDGGVIARSGKFIPDLHIVDVKVPIGIGRRRTISACSNSKYSSNLSILGSFYLKNTG